MNIDIRYLAGLIDGEGCITIFRHKTLACRDDHWTYRPLVQIGMVYKPLIFMLCQQFNVPFKTMRPRDESRRSYAVWTVRGQKCIDLLIEIEPFLIVKKEEAQFVLRYWNDPEVRLKGGTMKGVHGEAREALKAKREWYRLQLQAMKKTSFGPLWDGSELGENPMPGESAEGQPRTKQTVLKAVGRA